MNESQCPHRLWLPALLTLRKAYQVLPLHQMQQCIEKQTSHFLNTSYSVIYVALFIIQGTGIDPITVNAHTRTYYNSIRIHLLVVATMNFSDLESFRSSSQSYLKWDIDAIALQLNPNGIFKLVVLMSTQGQWMGPREWDNQFCHKFNSSQPQICQAVPS